MKTKGAPSICNYCTLYYDGPLSLDARDIKGVKLCKIHAAAPYLLSSLKECQRIIMEFYDQIDSSYTDADSIVMAHARAAIDKAEGR